jgi:hypothetical protein
VGTLENSIIQTFYQVRSISSFFYNNVGSVVPRTTGLVAPYSLYLLPVPVSICSSQPHQLNVEVEWVVVIMAVSLDRVEQQRNVGPGVSERVHL